MFLGIAFLVALSSVDYIKKQPNQAEYYSLLLFSTVGMMVVASATELITLFIGLELAGISTCALTGFLKKDSRSTEAATKYFIIGALVILAGILMIGGVVACLESWASLK